MNLAFRDQPLALSARHRMPEEMDDFNVPVLTLDEALRHLGRIHTLLRTGDRIWDTIDARLKTPGTELRVLDLACGGGDVLRSLRARAVESGLRFFGLGLDRNSKAVAYCRRRSGLLTDVAFATADVTSQRLPRGFDVVLCSLFLHHLSDDEAVDLLQRSGFYARRQLIVCDLLRSPVTYGLVFLLNTVLSAPRIAFHDGLRSVQAAFSLAEAGRLADAAGLKGARATSLLPGRFLLSWIR